MKILNLERGTVYDDFLYGRWTLKLVVLNENGSKLSIFCRLYTNGTLTLVKSFDSDGKMDEVNLKVPMRDEIMLAYYKVFGSYDEWKELKNKIKQNEKIYR